MILPHLSRKLHVEPANSSYHQDFSLKAASPPKTIILAPISSKGLSSSLNCKLSVYYTPKPKATITKHWSPIYQRKAFGFAEHHREISLRAHRVEALRGKEELFMRRSQAKLHKRTAVDVIERIYGVRFSDLEVIELSYERLERQAKEQFVAKVTSRAARIIQRYWRGRSTDQEVTLAQQQHRAASTIQRAWRRPKKQGPTRVEVSREAAVCIQRVWRGYR